MSPDAAAAAIADAESGRDRLAGEVRVPSLFLESLGVAIAVQITTAAVGLAGMGTSTVWWVPVGFAVFLAVAAVQLVAFRRLNGVWLGGLVSKVVGGTATLATVTYTGALLAALWAAYSDAWWLVVLFAIAGGAAWSLSGRVWLRAYRADPAAHSRGESPLWWWVVGTASAAGLVLLLVMQ